MLPDLCGLKNSLAERLRRGVDAAAMKQAPLVAGMQVQHQREGDRYSYETHGGEINRETSRWTSPTTIHRIFSAC